MSTTAPQHEPVWTDAEHDEIMRLHIVEGMTISGAKRVVFDQRPRCDGPEEPPL